MRHEGGFTLFELVIVAIVSAILAAVVTPLALSSLRAYDNTLSNLIVLDKLRYATERLAREIREVNYNSGSSSYAFSSMGNNSMAFTRSYYDSSGAAITRTVTVGNSGAAVTLTYSDMAGTGAQVLTDQISSTNSLTFAYYDKDGCNANTTPTLCAITTGNVRYVQITLTLTQNGNPYTQRTRVALKNR